MAFIKASKRRTKLRVAWAGPAGSGKTFTALQLAAMIPGKVALVDTEGESASKYANKYDFDAMSLTKDYHPKHFISAIKDAEDGGYSTLIIDSLSHEWVGPGGMLDLVGREKDKFGDGWKKFSPIHDQLVQAILTSKVNVFVTLRSKMAYERSEDKNGKTRIVKLGMAPVTREGMEYEFDFLLDLGMDGMATVAKSRAVGFIDTGDNIPRSGYPEMFAKLLAWAADGIEEASPVRDPAIDLHLQAIATCGSQELLKDIGKLIRDMGHGENAELRSAWLKRSGELKVPPASDVQSVSP